MREMTARQYRAARARAEYLIRAVPTLPRILAAHGYATIAAHPNVPVFWNRVNAYQRLGFETYWSLHDFEKRDMVRNFMSDASLYAQVLEKIEPHLAGGQPLLDYIVTYFGHWDYPLDVV